MGGSRKQLGASVSGVKSRGIIRKWDLPTNANENGRNLVVHPGKGFIDDYLEMYHSKQQPRLKFKAASSSAQIADPLELVVLFHKTMTGQEHLDTDSFSYKETLFASDLIAKHGAEAAHQFVSFATKAAKTDKFSPRQFHALLQYINPWLASRKAATRSAVRNPTQSGQ